MSSRPSRPDSLRAHTPTRPPVGGEAVRRRRPRARRQLPYRISLFHSSIFQFSVSLRMKMPADNNKKKINAYPPTHSSRKTPPLTCSHECLLSLAWWTRCLWYVQYYVRTKRELGQQNTHTGTEEEQITATPGLRARLLDPIRTEPTHSRTPISSHPTQHKKTISLPVPPLNFISLPPPSTSSSCAPSRLQLVPTIQHDTTHTHRHHFPALPSPALPLSLTFRPNR